MNPSEHQNIRTSERRFSSGQIVVIMLIIAMIIGIVIPGLIYLTQHEAKWTVKEIKSTRAFHLAEAGADRGNFKMNESTDLWDSIMAGGKITGYCFDTEYTDISGGKYKIDISSTTPSGTTERVKITSVGKDLNTAETRKIEVIYEKVMGLESAVTVGGEQEWDEGFFIHWGPCISYYSIELDDDQEDVYWPKKYCKGPIDPWDTSSPTNLFPPGSTEGAENYCGWAYKTDLTTPPEIDLDYYRTLAKGTTIPYPNDSSGDGVIDSNKDPWKNADGNWTGYFSTAVTSVEFKGYQFTNSAGCIFVEDASNVKLQDKGGRPTFMRLEAIVSARGNMHLHSDGITDYSVNVPALAYKQYLAGKPRTPPNTADHITPDTDVADEYPGDLGLHNSGDGTSTINLPCMFDVKKYTLNKINATGVAFHGFLYSGAEEQHCGGGKNIIVGCVWAAGELDVDTIIIYYDAAVGSSVKIKGGGIRRASWQEAPPSW